MKETEKRPIGPMGIAWKVQPFIVPAALLAAAGSVFAPGLVDFLGPFRAAGTAAAIVLAAFGLLFYLDLAVRLLSALRTNTLAERGTYAFCRHPLYAWWIFFVFPALSLALDNFLFFFCSVVTFAAVKRYLHLEDGHLEAAFGERYLAYRASTRELVPIPKRRSSRPRAFAAFVLFCAASGVVLAAVYAAAIRPVAAAYGSTPAERAAAYPLDELVPKPRWGFTQAVTIDAPAGEVWKWLVQVGYRRAGWYNLDFINGAIPGYFYEGNGSARRIVPELQRLSAGDTIAIAPGAELTATVVEPGKALVMTLFIDPSTGTPYDPAGPAVPAERFEIVWGYHLTPVGENRTRLVARYRSYATVRFPLSLVFEAVNMAGGGVLQQPAMFSGLKARAEAAARR